MGVGGQRHARAALPPGKTLYPLYSRLGGPKDTLDRCGKSHPHRGLSRGEYQRLIKIQVYSNYYSMSTFFAHSTNAFSLNIIIQRSYHFKENITRKVNRIGDVCTK